MVTQTQSGKSYEYAVAMALKNVLGDKNVSLVDSPSFKSAGADFQSLEQVAQAYNLSAATAAVEFLLNIEPNLKAAGLGKLKILVFLQSDQKGGEGDVRDIVIANSDRSWEIGISAKHQHEALKHSRLSMNIDFGKKWFGSPCSADYFAKLAPIFGRLTELKSTKALWRDVLNKDISIYLPILSAFREELLQLDKKEGQSIAPLLVSYLIGNKDFYKIIKLKHQVKIQIFNFNKTLNLAGGTEVVIKKIEKLKLPTRIVEFDFKRENSESSNTTLEMICDAGWALSFRLHNASSRVETSLKFDINLIGHPNNLQTFSVLY